MITWIVSKQQLVFWRNKCSYQLPNGVILAMATAKAAEYGGALTKFRFSKRIAELRWITHISRVKTQRRMTHEGHVPNLIADIIIRIFLLNVWHWIRSMIIFLTWKKFRCPISKWSSPRNGNSKSCRAQWSSHWVPILLKRLQNLLELKLRGGQQTKDVSSIWMQILPYNMLNPTYDHLPDMAGIFIFLSQSWNRGTIKWQWWQQWFSQWQQLAQHSGALTKFQFSKIDCRIKMDNSDFSS